MSTTKIIMHIDIFIENNINIMITIIFISKMNKNIDINIFVPILLLLPILF